MNKERLELIKNVCEIVALLVAAWWFLARGEAIHRLNISAEVQSLKLTDEVGWLRCDAVLENVGSTPITILRAKARLQQMLPLGPHIVERLHRKHVLLPDARRVVDWPVIEEHATEEKVTLAPGEKQMLSWEFQVPRSASVVRLYLYLTDSTDAADGWTYSRVHTLNWKDLSHEIPVSPSATLSSAAGPGPAPASHQGRGTCPAQAGKT